MKPISVHDYLWDTAKYPPQPVCAVFGKESYLRAEAVRHIRNQVLADKDAEFSFSRFSGDDVSFKEILGELQTVAMFGGGKRFVCIDEADKFISKNRAALENYAANPSPNAVLLLLVEGLPAATNLYKQLEKSGLLIEAKTLPEKEMPKWLMQWAKHHYQMSCEPDAAAMIVDRVGMEHGLLDQELAKLSLMADKKKGITAELAGQAVGSWRSRTVFEMLDSALAGQTAAAVKQLDALMLAGEDAAKIFAAVSVSLRKFAAAVEMVLEAERRKNKITVRAALEKAGIPKFVLNKTEEQLLKLGRHRGAKLVKWLLQLDLDLKGDSKCDRRILLEVFLVRISSVKLKELPK